MTEEIKTRQAEQEAREAVDFGQLADTGAASVRRRTSSSRPGFNRYIYENFLYHIEGQIECWNRKAVREPNPEAAHALWHKAEGLGYALRLLYAFEPEFRELVDCASHAAIDRMAQR